eukprot:589336-Karenia_brevis.AAC.1
MIATALLQAHMTFVFRMKRDLEHPEAANTDCAASHVEDAISTAVHAAPQVPGGAVELFTDAEGNFDIGNAAPISLRADKTILPKNYAIWKWKASQYSSMLHYWDGIPWSDAPTHEHLNDMSWILVILDYIAFAGDALTKDNEVWTDESILKLATTFKHATGVLSLNDPDL